MRRKAALQAAAEIASPLLLYYLLNMAASTALSVLWEDLFREEQAMWLLTAVNGCLIPVFAWMYRRDRIREILFREQGGEPRGKTGWEQGKGRQGRPGCGLRGMALAVCGAVCLSRGLNLFLGLTPLPRYFPGYEAAEAWMYHCSLLSQVMASVVSASVLEELLMRGLIYRRLRSACRSVKGAMLLSALIFGLFHGNVVQGIYAFCLGLFFAQVYENFGSLIPAVLAHGAANGATFLAVYLPFGGQASVNSAVYMVEAAFFLLAGAFFCKKIRNFRII